MVMKIVIISVFAYFTYKVEKYSFFFENDLKDYNNKVSDKNFDEKKGQKEFNNLLKKKKSIVDFLKKNK